MAARLLLLAATLAAWALPGSAASLRGSVLHPSGMMLSCTTPQTCGGLLNVAFEGYEFGPTQHESKATCLCMDGRRVVVSGPPADGKIEFVTEDTPLMSPGCWANMTWATAAPFVGACLGDLAGRGACSTACSQQLAPFNQRCFGSVLAETFLQYSDAAQPPSAEQAAAFYAACFPAVPAASAVTSGAAAGQQAGGLAVLAAAAAATALLLAEMSW